MASQQILFTVMPRGMARGTGVLPVSVLVSPRLFDADRLREFPDWLDWTARLADPGLSLTLRAGGREITRPVPAGPLRPDLWRAMFDEETYVRSHTFTDHSGRAILSWPMRFALSTLKTVYQRAGVDLALPDRRPPIRGEEQESAHRRLVRDLVDGLAVGWDDERGERLRSYYRNLFGSPTGTFFPFHYQPGDIGSDGLLVRMPPGDANRFYRERMAEQFAVVNHVPLGAPIADNPPDFSTLIDFHQALSSLSSYPELQRALGLVIDLDLPADFFDLGGAPTGTVSVSTVANVRWLLDPTTTVPDLPALETAYVLLPLDEHGTRLFATAPGALGKLTTEIEAFGLLNVAPARYGLAQVDIDGAMHKSIMLAETWAPGTAQPAPSVHPEVFDDSATLPALRSGGLSLFADGRALALLERFKASKVFNDALAGVGTGRPFFSEDLVQGYRLDVWDSHSGDWHSLHQRDAELRIGDEVLIVRGKEGFVQLAATQAAPDPAAPPADDLYLHEAVARWTGWSLSVPPAGRHLSSDPDPDKALDNPDENAPATPFKMTTRFDVAAGSLPSLRFGRRYRLRARVTDLCGNSLELGDEIADVLAKIGFAIPADADGFAYLRYEPVAAPIVVVRDAAAITGPGSTLHRLVIRTFNRDPSLDGEPADLTAGDRHLVPPRTTVDTAEKLSMFDGPDGKLVSSAAMYALIAERDGGQLQQYTAEIAGATRQMPLEPGDAIDPLPYLPDVLARGVALRDLPGAGDGTIGRLSLPDDPASTLAYLPLDDPNPRPGSATLVDFGGTDDWQRVRPVRLALRDAATPDEAPTWDAAGRVLDVALAKASVAVVPLSSFLAPSDLKLMGVWQWIREYIDRRAVEQPDDDAVGDNDADRIAHVLQRAVEGGHWMVTPPTILTLVHATQQPIGAPAFCALSVQHQPYGDPTKFPYDETRDPSPDVLQTEPEKAPTAATELDPVTAWRRPGAVDAYLLGGLQVHAASTEKIDLVAEWVDPVDDASVPRLASDPNVVAHSAAVDEIPLRSSAEGTIVVEQFSPNQRNVGYYDADHDLVCFVRAGDSLGNVLSTGPDTPTTMGSDAAPRHHLDDTKHHRISYTAIATSRFRECFDPDVDGGFTRASRPVVVDVPASERPQTPSVVYVVPTFGWQRQTETNVKRSIRFGGGLRVYLERGWFSSGADELLGVTLDAAAPGDPPWSYDTWKPYVTEWGADPIWQSPSLLGRAPGIANFPDAIASEEGVLLDSPVTPESPIGRRADVVGYPVAFDEARQLWYADITVDAETPTYCPFVRLALARYQPHAIPGAKLSRVVLADFAQLVPGRAAVVSADPYHPRRLRVTLSGIAPAGPVPAVVGPAQPTEPATTPTVVTVSVQRRRDDVATDLGWEDVGTDVATVVRQTGGAPVPDLVRWTGTVEFAAPVTAGRFRLVIAEHEHLSANHVLVEHDDGGAARNVTPGRLIYVEHVEIDDALIGGPPAFTGTVALTRRRVVAAPPRRRLAPLGQSVLARHGAALRRRFVAAAPRRRLAPLGQTREPLVLTRRWRRVLVRVPRGGRVASSVTQEGVGLRCCGSSLAQDALRLDCLCRCDRSGCVRRSGWCGSAVCPRHQMAVWEQCHVEADLVDDDLRGA